MEQIKFNGVVIGNADDTITFFNDTILGDLFLKYQLEGNELNFSLRRVGLINSDGIIIENPEDGIISYDILNDTSINNYFTHILENRVVTFENDNKIYHFKEYFNNSALIATCKSVDDPKYDDEWVDFNTIQF